ncbi:unnamed protein product [Malus baccata var. baccata]
MSTTHPFSNFCSGPNRFLGAFRDNVLEFVQEFDNLGDFTVKGPGVTVPLYIIEEDVKKLSKRPICDLCRITASNLLGNRSCHVIIPPEEGWNNPIQNGVLDLQNHIMYGLIHSDGYDHLLGIRVRALLILVALRLWTCGTECVLFFAKTHLGNVIRKAICVKDNSIKAGMDLRLLFGVACGLLSWYRIRRFAYVDSLNHIGSLKLSKMVESSFDLLSHHVGMIHKAENMERNSKNVDDIKELKANSKCKADKIRIAQANRPSVRDTAVLDHVLSNLDNVVVDEHHIFARQIYNRTCNDIKRLYDSYVKMEGLLGEDSNGEVMKVKECVQIIQNCKLFVKEFDIAAQGESLPLTFICQIPWPNIDWRDEHHSKKIQEERESPIGDIVVVVPSDATIRDLKETAQKGLKDSYYFLKECTEGTK